MDKLFLNIAFSLLCGVFTIFALSFTGFIFRITVNPLYAVIGLILAFGVYNCRLYFEEKKFPENIVFLNIIFGLLIISSIMLASAFPDLSWDGVGYHRPAIDMLAKGHNPVYEYDGVMIWIKCYPKFTEIFGANILSLTKNIEAGKAFNHLGVIIAFCLGYYLLSKERFKLNNHPRLKILFAFLLVYNPIVISQFSSYCTDAVLYLYFLIGAFAFIDIYLDGSKKLPFIIFIMSSVILANIKLGGLLCLACFIILGLLFKLKRFYLPVLITIILILISGISPYYTNIKNGHHPFYPLAGEGKTDIITGNAPKNFENKPSYYKFFYSTFSRVRNLPSREDELPVLKIPFSVHKGEIEQFKMTDVRVSGFGVFFSGICLLAFIMLCMTRFKTKEDKKLFFLMYGLCAMPLVLNPESWWARYVPYFWTLIVFIVMIYFINSDNKFQKAFCYIMIFIMFLNNFIINSQIIKPYMAQNQDYHLTKCL